MSNIVRSEMAGAKEGEMVEEGEIQEKLEEEERDRGERKVESDVGELRGEGR